jgi:signal transduction histidine kinase
MNQQRIRVLIVDDEIGPRESLRMILKDWYDLAFATNGKEAYEYVKTKDVDLVIMDIKMPVMDGMEALKKIKAHNPFVAVIMVTGYGTIDTAVEAIKLGAFDYISKPFDSFDIRQKVERALAEMREKREALRMMEQIQKASEQLSSQQHHLQEQLVQLSKLSTVGMLAQGLAHNLSSPLLIVLGRAELLKEKLLSLREKIDQLIYSENGNASDSTGIVQEYDQNIKDTEIIIQNVNKLSEIVKNMMNKCRQDQSNQRQLLNLSEILRTELTFLEADLYFKHQIEKHFQLDSNIPLVEGVYSDFSQAFLNLIQNAVEAMYESEVKRLTVRTSYDDRFVVVEIRDTGCGIPQENMDKIFLPFFTTKKSADADKRVMGTGLGLHMVETLMRPYGAKIEVQSHPGDTRFLLKIPYKRPQERASLQAGDKVT